MERSGGNQKLLVPSSRLSSAATSSWMQLEGGGGWGGNLTLYSPGPKHVGVCWGVSLNEKCPGGSCVGVKGVEKFLRGKEMGTGPLCPRILTTASLHPFGGAVPFPFVTLPFHPFLTNKSFQTIWICSFTPIVLSPLLPTPHKVL